MNRRLPFDFGWLFSCATIAALLCTNAAADKPQPIEPLVPVAVEAQPLAANIERLEQALDYLGAPFTAETIKNLREAVGQGDSVGMQVALDRDVAFVVSINPESRVQVARGPAPARLQQAGFTPLIVKVINLGAVTKPLRIHSNAGGAVYAGEYRGSLEREQQLHLQSGRQGRSSGSDHQLRR